MAGAIPSASRRQRRLDPWRTRRFDMNERLCVRLTGIPVVGLSNRQEFFDGDGASGGGFDLTE